MRVLLCNDDGIDAPGLRYAVQALSAYKCEVVAPMTDQSGSSHSTSTGDVPIRVYQRPYEGGTATVVAGTPADAVKFKLSHTAEKFDVMVSGINAGENGGLSHYYSGTVAAAREAAIRGVPAVSVSVWRADPKQFEAAGRFLRSWLPRWFGGDHHPRRPTGPILLNVNFPDRDPDDVKGVRIARQSMAYFDDVFHPTSDAGNDMEYQVVFGEKKSEHISHGSDDWALREDYITVVPLRLDATCAVGVDWLEGLHDAAPIFHEEP